MVRFQKNRTADCATTGFVMLHYLKNWLFLTEGTVYVFIINVKLFLLFCKALVGYVLCFRLAKFIQFKKLQTKQSLNNRDFSTSFSSLI